MNGRGSRWGEATYWALWGAALALYLTWPLAHLDAYAWSNDEGLYLQAAALANRGYPLYTVVALNKPPLFVWILQLAFHLAGQTLVAARLATLSLNLLGLVALGTVVGKLWGRWAGLASVWVLLALPEVPVRAHVVMNDLPAMTFALGALGAALSFRYSGRRIWIALSGMAYAGALLTHPLLVHTALPLAAILILPEPSAVLGRPQRRTGWRDFAVFLSVVAGAGLLVLAVVDRQAFFDWVLRGSYAAVGADVQLAPSSTSWKLVTEYLGQRWALVWLAAVGTAFLCTKPDARRGLVMAVAWSVAAAVTLVVWSPVWRHYLLFLAFPLAGVAGGGLAATGAWVIGGLKERRFSGRSRAVLVLLMLIGTVIFCVQRSGESLPHPEGGPEWSSERMAARTYLESAVPPAGFVVTDDPLLAFVTGRLVPPALTEASYKQIRLGRLTTGDLVESVLRYRAQAVLFATGRLALLPSFERWVATVAAERHDFGPLRAYYLVFPFSVSNATASRLDSAIALDGYALSGDQLRPGDVLTVTLFWRREGPVPEDYTVFVHLADEEDRVWGQHDGPPLMGAYPTSCWAEGLLLPDVHALMISPETPPGEYSLWVGMYHWPSLERLPAFRPDGSRWLDDCILLTELRLSAP